MNHADQTPFIELVKQWCDLHRKKILWMSILLVLVVLGGCYWYQYQIKIRQRASVLYDQLNIALVQKDQTRSDALLKQLLQQYSKTPYATLAAFIDAKRLIAAKAYQRAFDRLKQVFEQSSVNRFRQIARLRAARLLLFERQPQAALAVLNRVENKTYQMLIEDTKGDIYCALNQRDKAKKAYQSAKAFSSAAGIPMPLLDMKLASLWLDKRQ